MPIPYIPFTADINNVTGAALIGTIFDQINKGATEIYLMLSTAGGNVDDGIAVYNVLRGLPVPLTTHNIGAINSIGNVIFLGALPDRRKACPHSTFMYHGVGFDVPAAARFEQKTLMERLDGLTASQSKIGNILADRTQLTTPEIDNLFLQAQTKDTAFALAKGVISEIIDVNLPPGTPLIQLVFQR
jgi:ATP-dependent Clp protease protease subunit